MQDCSTYWMTAGSLVIGEKPLASLYEIRQNNPARLPAVDWVWLAAARSLRGTKQIINIALNAILIKPALCLGGQDPPSCEAHGLRNTKKP